MSDLPLQMRLKGKKLLGWRTPYSTPRDPVVPSQVIGDVGLEGPVVPSEVRYDWIPRATIFCPKVCPDSVPVGTSMSSLS